MGKKLKIAFLSRYVGVVDRGVETYVLELSKRLSRDVDVTILKGRDSDALGKMISGDFDICIATNGRLQALKAGFGRLFSRYKLIISGQAGIGKDDLWNLLVVKPDVYVALTDFELNWAKRYSWGVGLTKIPNGVDLNKFSPKGFSVDTGLEGKIALSVGALFWYKHHELTIEAVSRLSGVSLLIIGDGPQLQNLTALGNRLLGEKRFKILQVGFEEIDKYYRSADLFVLPSWIRESFGIAYIEALASNLPVVAPDDPPRREIIGSGGVLVDVFDIESFARAIEKALTENWGNKPRQQAEKFSWDSVAKSYIELIKTEVIKR